MTGGIVASGHYPLRYKLYPVEIWAVGCCGCVSHGVHGRVFLPIVMACLAYGYVISFRTWLFAFRYTLPILPFLLIFIAEIAIFSEKWPDFAKKRLKMPKIWQKPLKNGFFVAFVALCVFSMHLTFRPKTEHWLCYTAPQPRWKEAFALVLGRENRLHGPQNEIVTISAFPMFHDIYLGSDCGRKYYLPISHTGYHNQIQRQAPYAQAETITSLDQLLSINGYLILDDFSLRMIADPAIRDYLTRHRYNAYLPGLFNTYVWIFGK